MGVLQTWLLYHNALSAGVAIEDILKFARRSKERGAPNDETTIAELRAQMADQERTLRALIQTVRLDDVQITERAGLLAPPPAGGGARDYGSSAITIEIPVNSNFYSLIISINSFFNIIIGIEEPSLFSVVPNQSFFRCFFYCTRSTAGELLR